MFPTLASLFTLFRVLRCMQSVVIVFCIANCYILFVGSATENNYRDISSYN